MCSWEEIGQKWHRAQQMGWQAVQAAIEVGEELQKKRIETPHGEWISNVKHALLSRSVDSARVQANNLIRLALHRDLIEEQKPESMRGALALLPKVPRKVGVKRIKTDKDEVDKYEGFAKKTAKQQADKLVEKRLKLEVEILQNQAHDAVTTELKAVKKQLKKERLRVTTLMAEVREKRQHYQDLINKRSNGYDYQQALKILRQACHPDRPDTSTSLRILAMNAIQHIERFLDL